MTISEQQLQFVEPQFRERVTKRIQAIEEFLQNPGRKNAIRIGRQIGLSANGFYKIVRAWKAHQNPTDLVGRGKRPNLKSADHNAQYNLIRQAIAEGFVHGNSLAQEVTVRAEIAGVPMLSGVWIYDAARTIRREQVFKGINADLCVDVVVIDYPVLYNGGGIRPHLIAVIDASSQGLVGAVLCIDSPTVGDWSRALLSALGQQTSHSHSTCVESSILRLSMPDRPYDSTRLFAEAIRNANVEVEFRSSGKRSFEAGNRSLGKIAASTVGSTFLKRKIRTQLSLKPIEKRLAQPKMGQPIVISDAEAYIQQHIATTRVKQPRIQSDLAHNLRLCCKLQQLANL